MQGQLPSVTENTWKYWSYMIMSNSSTNNSVSTSTFSWVFPTILVGRLQHQPLLVELHLNDSAVCGRVTQGRSRDFSSKKNGKGRGLQLSCNKVGLDSWGINRNPSNQSKEVEFSITGNVQLLEKGFFHDVPFNWQLVLIFMRSMNIGRLTWNPSKQAPW